MKISLGTITISNDDRRAVWFHFNVPGREMKPENCPMASRDDCRSFIKNEGLGGLEDISFHYAQACGDQERAQR